MAGKDPSSPWWSPSRHADIRPFLQHRGAITRALRAWFESEGFTEVETGILQVSPGNETHLHAPRAELTRSDGERSEVHLPEFTMLEWYRANAPYQDIMADCVTVIRRAAEVTGIGSFSF